MDESVLQLTSKMVRLTPLLPEHAKAMFELACDRRVSKYLSWKPHQNITDTHDFIEHCISLWQQDRAYIFGIFVEQHIAGSIGLYLDTNQRAEAGTWFGTPWQGQGLNIYAKSCIMYLAFVLLGLNRLEMLVHTDNMRSYNATKKLPGIFEEGIQHARIVRGNAVHDAHMFAMTHASYDPGDWPDVTSIGSLHPIEQYN